MTLPSDELLRDVMVGLVPTDLEPPLERIHARVEYRKRVARVRWGVGVVSLVALVALTISALPGGAVHRVDISTRPSRPHRVATTVVPTTRRPVPTTVPAVVSPSTAHVVVAPTFPSVTTVPHVTPTTVRAVVPPVTSVRVTPTTQRESPPTTAPLLAYERLTLVLDDSGLHAPTQFTTAKQVDIIFLDQRTSATRVANTGVRVTDANGASFDILRPYYDPDCCYWFGAIGTLLHPLGVVTFDGIDSTNYTLRPGLHASTTMVAS